MEPSSDNQRSVPSIQAPPILKIKSRTNLEKDDQSSSTHTAKSSFSSKSFERSSMPPLQRVLTLNLDADGENVIGSSLAYESIQASKPDINCRDPLFEVKFSLDDPDNPRSWPRWYRILILMTVAFGSMNVVVHGSGYARSIPSIMEEFGVRDRLLVTMGVSVYLLGIGSGCLLLAPLGEIYGRKRVYTICMFIYCLLFLPGALGKSLPTILAGRFLSAFAGSVMASNSSGTVCDNFTGKHRPLALSFWSLGPLSGFVIGPLTGGFIVEYLHWRWNSWILMMTSVVAWLLLVSIKETYMPVLLRKKAKKLRKETGDSRWWSQYDHDLTGKLGHKAMNLITHSDLIVFQILKTNLSRPFVLAFTEPILWFWNGYITLIYSILYLCFVAYPIVYVEIRGWPQGLTGFGFLGIGVGTIMVIASEPLVRRISSQRQRKATKNDVAAPISITLVCIASILCPLGQLWFAWTSVPATIHWIWPMLATIPFGASICLVLVHGTNYLAEIYGIYAASALSGNVLVRNAIGGLLPLAGPSLYSKLGPQWTGTILGLILIVLIPVPFIFYKYGHIIQAKSPAMKRLHLEMKNQEKLSTAV
ncbi:hypothetical protein EPUL_004078, partial [Erysiphe pulchra]